MKFVYLDESGTGSEPIAVMAGVITDAYRMRPTKNDWNSLLNGLRELTERNVTELHTHEFYPGNGIWRGLDGKIRTQIIDIIFEWLVERKHHVVFTAVDKQKFEIEHSEHDFSQDVKNLWQLMAFHITLSIQRCLQGSKRGGTKRKKESKNNSVLVFDHQHREQMNFTELLLSPPEWSHSYYDKVKHQEELGKIVDVPHFVDSKQVGMIQLADFISFFIRKYLEIENGYTKEDYDGELKKLRKWYGLIESRCVCLSNTFPKRARCEAAEYFYNFVPESLKT